ncbi:MAG TPA: dTMP kinase [Candidatus Saccharimonadales bacterium]|nr:dTMP kinase [Candidatus Saccharimonadales bacterium]
MQGKIIDFEGIDGTGKSTQAKLLLNYLTKIKKKHSFYKFPQYKKTAFGKMVKDFLSGKLGELKHSNPYLISLPYAFDRQTVADNIRQEKAEGKIVVFDRYAYSTTAHQASRLPESKQKEFIDWQFNLEYKVNQLPKEDVVILLEMPVEESLRLISGRKRDLLEQKTLQEKTRKIYLKLAKKNPHHWLIINCIDPKGKLKSKNKIHQEIVELLKGRKLI